jgi:hypothetical protein
MKDIIAKAITAAAVLIFATMAVIACSGIVAQVSQ